MQLSFNYKLVHYFNYLSVDFCHIFHHFPRFFFISLVFPTNIFLLFNYLIFLQTIFNSLKQITILFKCSDNYFPPFHKTIYFQGFSTHIFMKIICHNWENYLFFFKITKFSGSRQFSFSWWKIFPYCLIFRHFQEKLQFVLLQIFSFILNFPFPFTLFHNFPLAMIFYFPFRLTDFLKPIKADNL